MEAIREITEWPKDFTPAPNHVYLMDGDKAVAYIKWGKGEPQYFTVPFRLVKTRRKFVSVKPNPFDAKMKSNLTEVKGSGGQTYFVDYDARTCTCPGFQFRGYCKHLNKHS
jgi:hypothetical protein